jgi:hypothetical protein
MMHSSRRKKLTKETAQGSLRISNPPVFSNTLIGWVSIERESDEPRIGLGTA